MCIFKVIKRYKKIIGNLNFVFLGAMAGFSVAGEKPGYPFPEHIDQHTIHEHSVDEIFYWGFELFEAPFNRVDGVGANLKLDPSDAITTRFTRSPRPDLPGWIANLGRPDGPQAQNCRECHNERSGNVLNEQRDPFRTGDISQWVERQTSNLSGIAALQLLAEQTSQELWKIRDDAISEAVATGSDVVVGLTNSNNVNFGSITAFPDGTIDTSLVEGVNVEDSPLLFAQQFQILPLQTKGVAGFIRRFVAGADITMGLQPPERYPEFLDGDSDGVIGELSVGDITAMTVYVASLARPVTKLELHRYGGRKFKLSHDEIRTIKQGKKAFKDIGCASCHVPKQRLKSATFNEPSKVPGFHFPFFWTTYIKPDGTRGTDPMPYGYDINNPVSFEITDLPSIPCRKSKKRNYYSKASYSSENKYRRGNKYSKKTCWREFRSDGDGGAFVEMYGDQKRYEMGPGLAEDINEFNVGASVWRTKELWGVGSTGPWLHDGRATTLTEAISWHGGDAEESRDNFFDLPEYKQDSVLEFLNNLVIYDPNRNEIQRSVIGYSNPPVR